MVPFTVSEPVSRLGTLTAFLILLRFCFRSNDFRNFNRNVGWGLVNSGLTTTWILLNPKRFGRLAAVGRVPNRFYFGM